MSAVGFDIGNETSYIATVKSGGIEILDNEYNLRSTPSYIAFSGISRDVGVAAKAKLVTNLKNTVFGFKRLLGRKYSDANVIKELEYLPHEVTELPSNDIGVKVTYLKKDVTFSVTHLMAMMLTKLKMITENKLGSKMLDCVISVPVYYTDAQRRAMLDAARISNLNPLRLMNESAAVSLAYGFYKQGLFEQDSHNVIFIDVGNSAVTVTACAFTKEKLKMLGCVWDNIGGRDFDNQIVQYFVDDFKAKYQLNVMSSKKAVMSLLVECETLKKQMSASSLELRLQIECFMNDIDVKGQMKRERFEVLSVDLLNRVEKTLNKILEETRLAVNDIHSVEIVGGSCRLPAIKHLIQKVFGKEPSSTLNQDEAVARGCALQCALISPSLKTRDFIIEDTASYAIKVTWINMESREELLEVFSRSDKVPAFKIISIPMAKSFNLAAYYTDACCPSEMCRIGNFKIENVPNVVNGFAKIKIKACLNIHGIFSIIGAEMIVRSAPSENRIVPYEEKNAVKKDVSAEDENMEVPEKVEQNEKPESSTESYQLSVASDVPGLSQEELGALIEVENRMIRRYVEVKERADARNALEEYIYDIRGKLNCEFSEYVKEENKTRLLAYLVETESWLYDNEDQEVVEFINKLRQSKGHFDPIYKRFREWDQRPNAINEYRLTLRQAHDSINELKGTMDEANAYQSEIDNLKKMWLNVKQFLDQWMETNSNLKKCEDATLTVEDLKKNLDKFRNEFQKSLDELREILRVCRETAPPTSGDGHSEKMDASNRGSQTNPEAEDSAQSQHDEQVI